MKYIELYNYFIRILMGQLSALFKKNWIIYKRSLLGNCLQIFIPIFFVIFILVTVRLDPPKALNEIQYVDNSTPDIRYQAQMNTSSMILKNCTTGGSLKVVALAPSGNAIVNSLNAKLIASSYTTKIFANQEEFESYIRNQNYQFVDNICFGIIVTSSVSPNYSYKLRFNISNQDANSDGPKKQSKLARDQYVNYVLHQNTLSRGMIGANFAVNNEILNLQQSGKSFSMKVDPIYQEPFTSDNLYTNLGASIGILTLLPLLLIYLRQTSQMLNQKESKIRQNMSIMGMNTFYYYFSWFIRNFAVYFVIHLICSIIIARQFKSVPFITIFIIFILFDIVLIIQNFFIQVFLSRAKIGVVISLLFFILQYVVSFVSSNSDNPTLSVNTLISIIPHCAFVLSFQTIVYAQSVQIAPSFRQTINNYSLGVALASFIINIVVYLILTWYLDQVVPNEWGAKKHPLFCCFDKTTPLTEQQKEEKKKTILESEQYKNTHEPIDQSLRALEKDKKVIQIVGLRKQWNGGQVVSVKTLTENMYNNQIFALLGHNGAGKTSTISMITGMTEPTDGYISVFGETQIHKIRSLIGVCPQHDSLYQQLTVAQHITLYSAFKGLQGTQLELQVQKLINDVNLSEKRDYYTKNLSGGQKRRLSVALAFAGRSKVIILDEPTSGMDTSARRYIWQLLKTYKNDRIILLTTHFMDEADYLGDRIGIMGDGQMTCCGSSIYLKNKFGVGYNITFVKESNAVQSDKIINLVKKFVPKAVVLSNVSTNLSLQLPMEDLKIFSNMFNEIDEQKDNLHYSQYGISITTLQEVFLKVGQELQDRHHLKENSLKVKQEGLIELNGSNQQLISDNTFDQIQRQTGACNIFSIHLKATLLKRFRVFSGNLKSFVFQLILPVVIMIFALLIMRISFITDLQSTTITLATYQAEENPVIIPISSSDPTFTASMKTQLNTRYSSAISVLDDTTAAQTAINFDKDFLLPKKVSRTFKGGIYFTPAVTADATYSFRQIVNTRAPTSSLFLQTLAAQTLINSMLSKTITITVVNSPMPRTYQQTQINNAIAGFFGSFIFALALAFKFASIISFIVKERVDRSKHQQIVSGMKISAYWIANFIYDFLLYLVVAIIAIILIIALKITAFDSGNALVGTILLFLFYGLAYIPVTYIFAYLFQDYGNAQAGYYFLTFVIGGMIPILTFILRILGTATSSVGRGLAWLLRLYPSFAFGQGLLNIGSVNIYGSVQNGGIALNPLALEVSLAPIIYLAVFFIIFFALVFVIQYVMQNQNFVRYFTSQKGVTQTKQITQSNVLLEYNKANAANPKDYEILTKNLRKVYMIDSDKKHKVAVDNLSLAIQKGQVFGLLGVNGAGKTTTFKMLAGQITSTSGDSYFRGLKINENLDTVREGLGYCPQFDALIQNLTVRQQLQLFYDLKSLSREYKDRAISKKIEQMNLGEYHDKLSGTLSGGNKRKLSVAMAMIGNPRIIFLDEPSTGMDPKARRFMWKVISRVATEKKNSTVILTTHSMEEAQALSTRLGIMVKGNFQCIGTPQHIKSKYGQGFEIQVKLQTLQKSYLQSLIASKNINDNIVKAKDLQLTLTTFNANEEDRFEISEHGAGNYIHNILAKKKEIQLYMIIQFLQISRMQRTLIEVLKKQVGNVQVIEKLSSFIRLKVDQRSKVSKLFNFFELNKAKFYIQQYTIKQATVEQIFNHFAQDNLSQLPYA